jgi:hypothetical protein
MEIVGHSELRPEVSDDGIVVVPSSSSRKQNEVPSSSIVMPAMALRMNKSFGYRMLRLQIEAGRMEHEFAYLSTLGGAYHLCDNPHVAYAIAVKQENLGVRLGSKALVLRARGYQAINIGLLGDGTNALKMLKQLERVSRSGHGTEVLTQFLNASRKWLKLQIQPDRDCGDTNTEPDPLQRAYVHSTKLLEC